PWDNDTKYRTLFDSIDEGFCVIEMVFGDDGSAVDYVFVEANPSFERQTGLANAMGRSVRDMVPAHESHWFEIYGDVALSGRPRRIEAEAAALSRWYDVYAFRVGDPAKHLVAVLFNDISERKSLERELRRAHDALTESEERFRSLVT